MAASIETLAYSQPPTPMSLWWGKKLLLSNESSQSQRIMIIGFVSTAVITAIGFILGGVLIAATLGTGGFLLTLRQVKNAEQAQYKTWIEQNGGANAPIINGKIDSALKQASITLHAQALVHDKTKILWQNNFAETIALISVEKHPLARNEGEVIFYCNPRFDSYGFNVSIQRENFTENLPFVSHKE